ncbi:MAG: SusC/RagA family TonB-linked outer membrane protein [Paludibacteraceae bacterium]|nr:SusC/RagA family TonB-linked outer membrane protein [Paludibacteraceae bacterium]
MKQYIKIFSIVIASLLISTSANAQAKIIHGQVIAKSDKLPIIGVSVAEYDANNRILNGTITDFDGNYTLRTSGLTTNRIIYSYVGYKTITRTAGNGGNVNIVMEDATQTIKEVNVTARRQVSTGNINIAERDLTFAMSKIETKDLEGLQAASIDEALQGRMSGVDIVANSGEPGSGMSIRIRGTTSINSGSDPLIVVDGIPFETNIGSDFDFATADEENYAQLLNISPADIEEISVLKDAAATAMYGNKGANGVLLIKTKRGTISKPRVSYTFKGSLNTPADPIKTLSGNEYTTLILEAAANAGTPLSTSAYPQFSYDPNNPYYYYNYGQNTDWYEALTRNGFTQDHNISLSGGGEKAMYRTSIGYYDQQGTVIGQGYSRVTASLNYDYNVSDYLKFQVSLSYTQGTQDKNYTTNLLSSAYTKMPNMSIYEYNTLGVMTPNYFSPVTTPQGIWSSASNSGIYNPVAMANSGYWKVKSERIMPKFNLQYWVIPEILKYQVDLAFDINTSKDNRFLPQTATGRLWPEISVNRATDLYTEAFVVQSFNRLYFTPKMGKDHEIISLAQINTYDGRYSSYQEVSALSASTFLQDPSIPANIIGSGLGLNSGGSQARTMSLLAMVQYKYLDRYIVNTTVRRDGDSKYGDKNRYGYFPSASVRWRTSNEPFMKELKFIDDLSLRASSGMSGNPVNKNYLYYNTYGTYNWTYLDEQGVYSTGLQLANLRWEKVTDFNLGANLIMFDNRINMDFNWYKKRTNDLYFPNVGISSATGFSRINQNVGVMDNRGWELSVFTTPVKTKDWQVDFNLTFARSENEVMELSDNIPLISTPTAANNKYLTKIQVGNPLGSFYGYRYEGVYLNEDQTVARDKKGNPIYTYTQDGKKETVNMRFWYPSIGYEFQPGDAKYADINHDGNINSQDIVYLGDVNPTLTGGFGPTIRWKRKLTVSAYFYYRYGFEIINQTRIDMESMNGFNNQSTAVLKRWRHPYEDPTTAPADLLPRALLGKGYNFLGSDRFVEDGSFLRFKSLTVNYNFDREKVRKFGLSEFKIWATMQNIYIWTNYSGMDPEVTLRSGIGSLGYDTSRSGRPMEFSLGTSVSF